MTWVSMWPGRMIPAAKRFTGGSTVVGLCAILFFIAQLQSCTRPQDPQRESVIPRQPSTRPEIEQLNASIPAAHPELYKNIFDGQDWLNPYLHVCSRDITLVVRSITKDRRVIQVTDLRRTLVDLTVAAWPYGRVIAVQDCSIGNRNEALTANIDAVLAIVKDLRLEVERWPP